MFSMLGGGKFAYRSVISDNVFDPTLLPLLAYHGRALRWENNKSVHRRRQSICYHSIAPVRVSDARGALPAVQCLRS